MARTIRPLFSWRAAICKSDLDPSTKLTLFALSFYMNEMGTSCFPTQVQLVSDTSLSRRQIQISLKTATTKGWIKRQFHGFKGQKWKNHEYFASIPIGSSQYEPISLQNKGGAPHAPSIEKEAHYTSEAGAPRDIKEAHRVRTNTPYNSSLTLQEIEEEKDNRLRLNLAALRLAKKS